ncbi:e3 ubiquitin-protein ligase Mdm2 [Trichonephila inaurata madagascariensis]|uniref:E3 ubiquitin-protein ligase Mdm2 n=1 Tax=Trichonephila inaurata madagascariensis TaxID=2747483 RepID=A0A8X6XWD9_9ARAC|nr:e3 ubiquitin-protein ligase Mdm2 [Trichonephila inaurata madagascariensis]
MSNLRVLERQNEYVVQYSILLNSNHQVNCIPNMEPKVSASAASPHNPYSVLVSKDLMQVINPVGLEMTSEHLTTMDKVLKSVKDYIIQRKLFDPKNPLKVIVKNDELGSVFGLSEFTLLEIRKILEKFVFPVNSKDIDSPEDIGVSKNCLSAGYDSDEGAYSVKVNCVLNMEPKISASAASAHDTYSVLVSKDLMQVINPILKEMTCEHLTTMDKLFDPNNPEKVIVKNDELGSVFGLSEFTLLEIRKILEKFVFPVSSKDTDSAEVICSYSVSEKALKRKLEAPEDIGVSKKSLSVGYDSDESVYSVQDYETEFVKDTSDDNLCVVDEDSFPGGSILTIRETFDVNVEYEIETSDSDRDRNCFTTDSDSDFDFQKVIESAIFPLLCQTYSDAEYLADNSSDENTNSFDFEISEKDKWLCRTCSTQNDPLLRRCASCWKLRCGWVSTKQANVERNPRKRKARNRKKRKKATDPKNKESPPKINQYDSPSTSQENLSLPSSSYSSEGGSQSSQNESKDLSAKLCIICCSKPINSSIIHGKVGHSVSCYRCARKLQSRKDRCPICRRSIERVVYLITN